MNVKSESEVAQSCLTLATPWTAAYQDPLSMGFSRQEYWSGVPLPSPPQTLPTAKWKPTRSPTHDTNQHWDALFYLLDFKITLLEDPFFLKKKKKRERGKLSQTVSILWPSGMCVSEPPDWVLATGPLWHWPPLCPQSSQWLESVLSGWEASTAEPGRFSWLDCTWDCAVVLKSERQRDPCVKIIMEIRKLQCVWT